MPPEQREPSSRAHVSSRGRRRVDGCRRAGTAFWARQPRTFVQGCPTVLLAIGLHWAAFPTLAVLPRSDHRSWSHVARRQPRRWSYVASVHRSAVQHR
jgi:hypothetical protein